MKHFVVCIALLISASASFAAEFDWFPDTAETVGANLPPADLRFFNKRFAKEVVDRFDFRAELQSDALGKIKGKFLDYSKLGCKGAFSDENDFIRKVIIEGRFDREILDILRKSNLEPRALEYLMYMPSLDDRTYGELRAIPVNTLTKKLVERWLISEYLSSKAVQATIKRVADHIWKSECGAN